MIAHQIGIVYLLTHMRLAARLVVSLYSLRRWYRGPVTLFTTRPESHEIGDWCAADPRLRIDHRRLREQGGHAYVSAYLTKATLPQAAPYPVNVFLDADTLVCGPLHELFAAAASTPLVVTGFCGETTTEDPVKTRLQRWQQIAPTLDPSFRVPQRVQELLNRPYPVINTGVMSFGRGAPFASRWDQLAMIGRQMPLPDETSLQILLAEIPHVFLGHQYNCHPLAFSHEIGAHIWHFAGRSHLSELCCPIWLPAYQECVDLDVARISSWSRVEVEEETAEVAQRGRRHLTSEKPPRKTRVSTRGQDGSKEKGESESRPTSVQR